MVSAMDRRGKKSVFLLECEDWTVVGAIEGGERQQKSLRGRTAKSSIFIRIPRFANEPVTCPCLLLGAYEYVLFGTVKVPFELPTQ